MSTWLMIMIFPGHNSVADENGQDLRFTSLLKVLNALDVTLEEFFSEGFD
ncbi:MAG: hypothetical protein V9F01_05000 [Chitinophagaceae bacterium]